MEQIREHEASATTHRGPRQGASDTDLVIAARQGCARSFEELFGRHAGAIHGFAQGLTRSDHDAADVTQATFTTASQRLGQLRQPASFRPWLFAIARHDALRRIKVRDRVRPVADLGATLPIRADSNDHLVHLSGLRQIIAAATPALTERYQQVIALQLDAETDSLATTLGITAHHAGVLRRRANLRLREALVGLLLARDPASCATLRHQLASWDGRYTGPVHRRVASHQRHCATCASRSIGFQQISAA